jgi:hypothetical protein
MLDYEVPEKNSPRRPRDHRGLGTTLAHASLSLIEELLRHGLIPPLALTPVVPVARKLCSKG